MNEVKDIEQASEALLAALDRRQASAQPIRLWLRDDDATRPGPRLSRLLALMQADALPLTLAVIPALAEPALAQWLTPMDGVSVAVHGWQHVNHAPPSRKKQELGLDRGLPCVLDELARGLDRLQQRHGGQCEALLVPPWNRIADELPPHLPSIGYRGLSVFANQQFQGLPVINTHVDIIDWKGHRGGRDVAELLLETAHLVDEGRTLIGVLTHHQLHDETAWDFLQRFVSLTRMHPAVRWQSIGTLLSQRSVPDPGLPQ